MPPRRPRRTLKAVAEQEQHPRPPDLRATLREALPKMTWLGPSDEALAALALRMATEIETAVERVAEFADLRQAAAGDDYLLERIRRLEAMCDLTKTVGWLGPQLQGLLRDLGGNPAARKALQPDKPVGGRLAQLRQAAAGDGQE